ncbi:MAG: prepilin peptidase [Acidobacteriota bacterium]|nr:prepilin peptidase [Acidobacteriota bacterium]
MRHLTPIEILAVVLVLIAAVSDFRTRRIPNWLTLPGVCAGLVANTVLSGVPGLKSSLEGLAMGLGIYLLLYIVRAMGAGDAKLMAALGSILGPRDWFFIFLASSIVGGIFAVILMIRKGRAKETLRNSAFIATELAQMRAPYERRSDLDVKNPNALRMPHGVAIAVGTIACLALSLI